MESMSSTKLGMSTFSETSSLEAYEAQSVLLVDHPHPRWCPADLTEKLLSSNIVQLPVRKEGSVLSLWQWVFIEAKSICDLNSNYGATAVRDILKYVDIIRFCFRIETREQRIAFVEDGYAKEAEQGVNTRLDYFDIPVTRGVFRTKLGDRAIDDDLVRTLSRMYFDVTRYNVESSPELTYVFETEEDLDLKKYTATIMHKEYLSYGRKEVIEAYMSACERKARRR